MILIISSLIVLAGCIAPWLAGAEGDGGWVVAAASDSGAARSSAPMMIRMLV